ncbi:MAG: hypothetical protein ACKVOR_06205 [Flavobacteriales bacterium]
MSIVFMLSHIPAHCQPTSNASLSAKGILQIPAAQPLRESYLFDLSTQQFSSDDELIEFISTRSGEFFSVRASAANEKVMLILNLSSHPKWTIADWNKYLMEATAAHPFKPE